MAPLSSCHVSGVFSLSGGSRNTEPSYYARYLSALEFTDDNKFINVSVRKFTPSADVLYADNSFVFMVAKAALPAGEDGMLDSLHCTLFESTPEDFESSLPPEPTHTMFVTGTVGSIDSSGPMRSFVLTTSEYVRDERRTFDIRFEYDGGSNRWKNVRPPATGSVVTATGTFQDIARDGRGEPVLNLLDISYGATEAIAASPTRTIGHRKARKHGISTEPSTEPRSSSPLSALQPSAEGSSSVIQTLSEGRAPGKRRNEEVEGTNEGLSSRSKRLRGKATPKQQDEVEGTDEVLPPSGKNLRTRKAKTNVAN